jgi:hypothetical protein
MTIKGTKGFTFEFKHTKSGLAFIRYQEGERETSRVNYMNTALFSADAMPGYVRGYLRSFAGACERVIKFASELAVSKS